jgi:threonine dehydrogenase-like Zn-dependent dehydrogenase
VVDGELPNAKLPLVLGHEVVGTVVQKGECVERFHQGDRVGVPWLGHTCGACRYCRSGRENLCDRPGFTGYTLDGGYAGYMRADHRVGGEGVCGRKTSPSPQPLSPEYGGEGLSKRPLRKEIMGQAHPLCLD